MKQNFAVFIFSILTILGCAQTKQPENNSAPKSEVEKLFSEAVARGRKKDYKKAHELYARIIAKDPDYIKAYLMKGGLYYVAGDWENAGTFFREAISRDPDYDIEVYYSMALLNNNQKKFREAADYLKIYISKSDELNPKLERAEELYNQLDFKARAIAHPVSFHKERLPFPINTENPEYVPLFTADGRFLIFVRRTNQQEDLYISEYSDGKFSMPRLISEITTMENEGVHSISADGRTLVFTGCNRRDSYGSCDLYYTKRKADGTWNIPSNMGQLVNSIFWDSQPSLSADGNTLYFSSTREGGVGGRDIWVTSKDETGRWNIPENLSGAINTLGNDETPFIHADGKTLYYRSNGRLGMGGYDLYWSRYDPELGEWSVPENLGYPINTEADEGGLSIDLRGEMAYYSSNEHNNDVDIYRFPLPEELRPQPVTFIAGKVKDFETGDPLNAKISIHAYNQDYKSTVASDDNGNFLYALLVGESYGFTIEKEGYIFYSEYIGLDSFYTSYEPFEKTFLLRPTRNAINEEKSIVLNNIFFKTGSAELLSKSDIEIKRLYNLLSDNPEWTIKITGHTDEIGTEEANMTLSLDRAKAVVDALIMLGMEEKRLIFEGKGESSPIASNETEEGRQKNRRTEFTIMKNQQNTRG